MKSSPLEPFIKVLLWKSSLQLWPQWQVVGADCISVLFKKAGLTLSYAIRMVNLSCLTHKEKKKMHSVKRKCVLCQYRSSFRANNLITNEREQ